MDYDNWNNLKKELSNTTRAYFDKSEIWFVSLGKNIGDEEDGKNQKFERPVLIIRKFNNNVFLGVPLTSQSKVGKYYITLQSFNSVAIISQIRLFDSRRLIRKIGKIDSKELLGIKNKIRDII